MINEQILANYTLEMITIHHKFSHMHVKQYLKVKSFEEHHSLVWNSGQHITKEILFLELDIRTCSDTST